MIKKPGYNILVILILLNMTLVGQDSNSILKSAYKLYEQSDYKICRDYCLKALETDSTNGEAYILIGSAYIQSADQCSTDQFSKGLIFCLAVDKFQKAIEVDSSLAAKAEKLIDIYTYYFPSRETNFIDPKEGEIYSVNCWINETTILRFCD